MWDEKAPDICRRYWIFDVENNLLREAKNAEKFFIKISEGQRSFATLEYVLGLEAWHSRAEDSGRNSNIGLAFGPSLIVIDNAAATNVRFLSKFSFTTMTEEGRKNHEVPLNSRKLKRISAFSSLSKCLKG